MKWPTSCTVPSMSRHFRSLLRACARQTSLDIGKKLHAIITITGLAASPTTFLRNALLHMYAVCCATDYAHKLFDEIPHQHKDTADWTTLMGCFARHGLPNRALILFMEMQKQGVKPDDLTMVCFFTACARLFDDRTGAQGHACMVKMGLGCGIKASNAIMDVYVKCGLVSEARRVFDEMNEKSVVSWTVILDGMVKWEGVTNGRVIFDEMPERNEVAWTIMIVVYLGSGLTREGCLLLGEMIFDAGFKLNHVTLCSILSACTQLGDLMMGKWVHVYSLKTMEKEMDIMVATALVDMYAKCGSIDTAIRVFEMMPRRNVVTWNALLSALAMHGRGESVLDMFAQMIKEVEPDEITPTCILSACSHSGLVDQGSHFFNNLESSYGIKPKPEHYACMVDLLGRAGCLEEAEILMRQMPIQPNEVVLGSLIGSCSVHGKLQLGESTLQEIIQKDPNNTEYHILLSNMYALAGKHGKANSLRQVLKQRGIRKVPGMSFIHVRGQVQQFSAGDKSHPQTAEIYAKLDEMIRRLRLAGYTPNTSFQVFSGSEISECNANEQEEEKEQALFSHSEKLAVCFGLISTRPGVPLYIFKNLRICPDCHSAIKIASKVYDRQIVVRDRNRFHCFNQGSCSCSDYW